MVLRGRDFYGGYCIGIPINPLYTWCDEYFRLTSNSHTNTVPTCRPVLDLQFQSSRFHINWGGLLLQYLPNDCDRLEIPIGRDDMKRVHWFTWITETQVDNYTLGKGELHCRELIARQRKLMGHHLWYECFLTARASSSSSHRDPPRWQGYI